MSDEERDNALRGRDLIGLGGLLVAGVVAGLVVGLLLDDALGTTPIFVLVCLAVGMGGAAVAFWLKVRDALRG
jgi:F0F1-type ATP synthase assembly protein I